MTNLHAVKRGRIIKRKDSLSVLVTNIRLLWELPTYDKVELLLLGRTAFGLLLHIRMFHGLCVCVCVLGRTVSPVKTAELMDMPSGADRLTRVQGTMY